MIALVNTNRMSPPIAPLGLEYVAGTTTAAGLDVEVIDLGLADDPDAFLSAALDACEPQLVGLSFRNVDDCFWPSARSFLGDLTRYVSAIRERSDAPVLLGGVGYSIFPTQLLAYSGADFGIHGDGDGALAALAAELRGGRDWSRVPGLVYRRKGAVIANPPAWPADPAPPTARDILDNRSYFRRGGQIGLETKRGCPRLCSYCADPLAKGRRARLRDPRSVADEVSALLARGIDVLHLCDAEFNLPPHHAAAVCDELVARGLGERVRWYAYLSVTPFSQDLARRMRRAGCAGINFTSDASDPAMLRAYRQPHDKGDLANAVRLCREQGIRVMLDMLLGGPGETPRSVAATIADFREIDPDCAGAALGIRLYPGTAITATVAAAGRETIVAAAKPPRDDEFSDSRSGLAGLESASGIRRKYDGPIDLLQPTFYVSPALGDNPAALVRELIDGDERFFPPADEAGAACGGDHNYNDNAALTDAITAGARGAYWDILSR